MWRVFNGTQPQGDPEAWCHAHAVDYQHPVDDPSHFTFCPVPEKGFDGLAFMAVALLVGSVMQGKMAALWVLIAGGVLQAVALNFNLGPMGNAINLWLGVEPAELFLFGFLPPLLLESSLNIEFFLFRKVLPKVMTLAFLVVLGCTALMVPWLLFGLGLSGHWDWVQAALFVAVIASTDAVTVNALLKAGGGPEETVVLMEGESLFNDASSMVLFTIFFALTETPGAAEGPILPQLVIVGKQVVVLALGGAVVGYAIGYFTRKLLGWMQLRRCKPAQELAVVFAMSYLAFYVGQALLEVSGVIAVVVYGLYGCAKGKWEISNKAQSTGAMSGFMSTVTHGINGLVFFYAGASCVNFIWRSIDVLATKGLLYNIGLLLAIYVSMFVARYLCIWFFNIFFTLAGAALPSNIIMFATLGGLRGALSLIMAQVIIQAKAREHVSGSEPKQIDLVTAQLVFWSSGFVLLTLVINAPLMPTFMKWTGLAEQSKAGKTVRAKARRALLRFTAAAIKDLKEDDDEILRGVDWKHVEAYTDLSQELLEFCMEDDTARALGAAEEHDPKDGLVRRFMSAAGIGAPRGGSDVSGPSVRSPLLASHTTLEEVEEEPIEEEEGDEEAPSSRSNALEGSGRFGREAPLMRTGTLVGGSITEATMVRDVSTSDDTAPVHDATAVVLRHAVGVLLPPPVSSGDSAKPTLRSTLLGGSKTAATALPRFFQFQQAAVVDTLTQYDRQVSATRSPLTVPSTHATPATTVHRSVSTRGLSGALASSEDAVAEARMRLVGGIKRFLHAKRSEGLLSSKGLRILDFACDEAIDNSGATLNIWASVEVELMGRWWVATLARWHLLVRQLHMWMGSLRVLKVTGLPQLVSWYSGYLSAQLSEKLLLACETALAYYLALSFTPFAQWLAENGTPEGATLQTEITAETSKAWQFVVDREVEAPERFQAIQSYRAAMAVMHQQLGFVGELYQSGMIDEAEREKMEEPIEMRITALEHSGATWRAPRTREILMGLPFLANASERTVDEFLAAGTIRTFNSGDVIYTPLHVAAQTGGMYVVINGCVKGYVKYGDRVAEFFLGSGRVFGLMSTLTGESLPGSAGILAAGNALGKGPVLFHVPRIKLQEMLAHARTGDPQMQQLEVDLHRVACLYTVERLRAQLLSALTSALCSECDDNDASLRMAVARPTKKQEARVAHEEDDEEAPSKPEQRRRDAKAQAQAVLQRVRDGLGNGDLVRVASGEVYQFSRDTVLVSGAMSVKALVGRGQSTALVQLEGPAVLPWVGVDDGVVLSLRAERECLLLRCMGGGVGKGDAGVPSEDEGGLRPLSVAMAGLYAPELINLSV